MTLSALRREVGWESVAIIRDITGRKQVQERLRETEGLYRAVVETWARAWRCSTTTGGSGWPIRRRTDLRDGFGRAAES